MKKNREKFIFQHKIINIVDMVKFQRILSFYFPKLTKNQKFPEANIKHNQDHEPLLNK